MQLSVPNPDPSATAGRESAALLLNPSFQAFTAIASWEPIQDTQTQLTDVLAEIQAITDAVTGGDMKHPEAIAVSQATALNVMFARLSRLAFNNISNPEFDSLMRLAFRAQSQCVRAIEALTTLRNPSVFAHQLNVANQQIVNNAPSSVSDPNLVRFAETEKTTPQATPELPQT